MATAKTQKLTDAQQEAIIKLYESGMTKYTEIQRKLKLPYISINKFMTKWKAQHGVLRSRAEANKNSLTDKVELSLTDKPTQIKLSEYQFLKNFYLQKKIEEDMSRSR